MCVCVLKKKAKVDCWPVKVIYTSFSNQWLFCAVAATPKHLLVLNQVEASSSSSLSSFLYVFSYFLAPPYKRWLEIHLFVPSFSTVFYLPRVTAAAVEKRPDRFHFLYVTVMVPTFPSFVFDKYLISCALGSPVLIQFGRPGIPDIPIRLKLYQKGPRHCQFLKYQRGSPFFIVSFPFLFFSRIISLEIMVVLLLYSFSFSPSHFSLIEKFGKCRIRRCV